MTFAQLARKVRSLYYRQKLLEGYQALEQEVLNEIMFHNVTVVGGFLVEVREGKVKLTPLPTQDYRQLELFDQYEEKGEQHG
jgi:hypothetical protein